MAATKLYGQDREYQLQKQIAHWDGAKEGLVAIVSWKVLSSVARNALTKSFSALNWGADPCTFITLQPTESELLQGKDLLLFLEALDPSVLVITDGQAVDTCQEVYRESIPTYKPFRLFGRETRAFTSMEEWIIDERLKHRVWSLLKTLAPEGN